ncbi:hypothetical protein BU26DRAFT_516865 [Trematosphaeria pertusa]|uniref:Uncharacterized protein n=1 Tax=Trematosphaeria pertusa TaxID=390896 RepID=A0A6A6IP50_9PLEO|nr:uncharacterized protein BU26DRAFT_516865 [Trematosphaeria pertusa]KAF2252176.1 hypothetical protein BU26DRAFT_516865 [Trematosphaeria pertusa]
MLEKEQAVKSTGAPASAATKAATIPPAKDKDAATPAGGTGPNRQRRRPRKLNKEPAPAQNAADASTAGTTATSAPPASTAEIEALKSRVRGLEAKVEELYKSTEARTGRSPRRRGKGRKDSSSTQVPTIATVAETAQPAEEEEADEELTRLEDELEVARRDLETFRPRNRPRGKRTTSEETVEEIPRSGIGATDDTVHTGDRQVTLTGNYRIPLPAAVSMSDVKSIQSGVSAAQNVAKSFLEQRRAAQATQGAQNPKPPAPKPKKAAPSMEVSKETNGQTWSEWFGGYSMAVSRAVKNIEAEAAIESQRRPTQAGRTVSAPSSAKRAAGGGTAAKAGTQRPGMKARQGNLSSEQVQGLMR